MRGGGLGEEGVKLGREGGLGRGGGLGRVVCHVGR